MDPAGSEINLRRQLHYPRVERIGYTAEVTGVDVGAQTVRAELRMVP